MNTIALKECRSPFAYTSNRHKHTEEDVRFVDKDIILKMVENHFGYPIEQLKKPSRKRELVYARHIGMWLLVKFTNLSLTSIGSIFGGRDHTTVIHGTETLKDLMDSDDKVFYEVKELINKLLPMEVKVTSESELVAIASEAVHLLNNIRHAAKKCHTEGGFENRKNRMRWEEEADAFLERIAVPKISDTSDPIKITMPENENTL